MSCLCMLQSISRPAGGAHRSEPPTCSGAPAVVDSPSVTYESLSSRVSSELCSPAWRLHHSIPNKRKAVCVCVCVCVCVHIYQVGVQSCWQAVNNTSGGAESGRRQTRLDMRAKAVTWLSCCFVITENSVLDVAVFEFWKHLLHMNMIYSLCWGSDTLGNDFNQ